MSSIERTFPMSDHAGVDVKLAGGDVDVRPGEEDSIGVRVVGSERVLENVEIVDAGGVVTVRTGTGRRSWSRRGVDVFLTVPPGCDVAVATSSGDVRVTADVADTGITVGSGDVHLGRAEGRVEVKAASGSVVVDQIDGAFSLTSVSGDVVINTARGDGSVATASGDVAIGLAAGSVTIGTVSGDTDVERFEGPSLDVKSVSGDIGIGLSPGLSIDADVTTGSGSIRNLIEPASPGASRSPATLRARSVSGDVTLRSAG